MMHGKLSPRFMSWMTAVMLLLIFGAGMGAGYGLARIGPSAARRYEPQNPLVPGPGMYRRLGLTPEQRKAVEAILQKYRPELDAILRETAPRVREVNERILDEIRLLLDENQRQRLERLRNRPFWMRGPRGYERGPMMGPMGCPMGM